MAENQNFSLVVSVVKGPGIRAPKGSRSDGIGLGVLGIWPVHDAWIDFEPSNGPPFMETTMGHRVILLEAKPDAIIKALLNVNLP